jgi:hypothetical protein
MKEEGMSIVDRRTALVTGIASASIISSIGAFADEKGGASAEERLHQLGIELPKVAVPVANYVPATRLGNLVSLLAQVPAIRMALGHRGKLVVM